MHTFKKTELWMIGLAMAVAFGVVLAGCFGSGGERCCTLSEPQPPIQNQFKVSDAPELVVKSVSGPIHVTGDSSGEIRLTATETVQGNSADDIARAKREVQLAVKQEGNRILACVVNGPSGYGSFDHGADGHATNSGNTVCEGNSVRTEDHAYRVRFDFELHVPAATKVTLSTVNDGDIKVERVSGGFNVQNVNGGVELDAVSGAGDAKTVNGDVKATFAANPGANCSFSTVNGSVHTYFRPNLSAQLRYKTLNGEVYTDFPVNTVGDTVNSALRRFSSGQVGSGGPEIRLDTLNGNIFVHRAS
jgi:hypothetical protein